MNGLALLLAISGLVDGRVIFQNGPVPGLSVTIPTGQSAAKFVSVNDAMQVAAIVGINATGNCDTGGAVLIEDHGTYSLALCSGMTIGSDVLTRPDGNAMQSNTGMLGDDGVIVTPAFVNNKRAVVRFAAGVASVLAVHDRLDALGNTVAFVAYDEVSVSDNGGAGFTSNTGTRVYWAPIGSAVHLCEPSNTNPAGNVVATETALWYSRDGEAKRCQIIDGNAVVDTPFAGGSNLPGTFTTLDYVSVAPIGGGRTGVGLTGYSTEGEWFWKVDGDLNATLVAPATMSEPYPSLKALSSDGFYAVVQQELTAYGAPSTYERNGSQFWITSDTAPGEADRYIVDNSLFAAVANDGTVWLQAATATAITESGNTKTLYRALPGEPLQRMLGEGDLVEVSSGTYAVGILEFTLSATGYDTHSAAIANAVGAAVASVRIDDGNKLAVLLLGEPQIPDLVPFANATVSGAPAGDVAVGTSFDLELGLENRGIGTARGDVVFTFAPSLVFAGAAPEGCTVVPDGDGVISGLECDASAFADIITGGAASVALTGVAYDPHTPLPGTATVHMEAFQIGGASEQNIANNTDDVVFTLRLPAAHLDVIMSYSIDSAEHLVGTLNVINEGPEDALDVSVLIPGVPAPIILPTDCEGTAVVVCTIDRLTVGASRSFSFDFGRLLTSEVAAPFEPQVESLSTDPGTPEHTLAGDPEELLKTDVQVTAVVTSVERGNTGFEVTVTNISGITAYEVIVLIEDVSFTIAVTTFSDCRVDIGSGSCDAQDFAPGESRFARIYVDRYGANAGVRVTLRNEDRDLTNNRADIAGIIDELQDGDGVGDNKKSSTKGCSAAGASEHSALLLVAMAGFLRARGWRRR